MSEAKIPWREVLSRWQIEQYVDAADIRGIEGYLEATQAASRKRSSSPWYIRILIGVGAWIAASCFLMFFGLLTHDVSQIVFGVLLIGGAVILRLVADHDFTTQLALALSVAGHAITLSWASHELFVFLIALLLCGLLYFTYQDWLHRFLSSLLVTITCAIWLADANYPNGFHLLVLIEVLGINLFFTGRHGSLPAQASSALRPLAFALAVSVLGLLLVLGVVRDGTTLIPLYPSKIILGLSLLYLYWWASAEEHRLTAEKFTLLVIPTLILSIVTTPGILAALALLIIGYRRDERLLLALGGLFFPVFLTMFYYNLEVDLLTKSLTLMGSGVVLLAARSFLSRSAWTREKVG